MTPSIEAVSVVTAIEAEERRTTTERHHSRMAEAMLGANARDINAETIREQQAEIARLDTACVLLDDGRFMTLRQILDDETYWELCTVCWRPECTPVGRTCGFDPKEAMAEYMAEERG